MLGVAIIYLVSVVLAIIAIIIYWKRTSDKYKMSDGIHKEVSNTGIPIQGACQFFKIVNR